MFNQVVLWGSLLAPYGILFFLPKMEVKRFFPASIFGALLLSIVFQIAEAFHWWKVTDNLPFLTNTTPFVYGLFLVGTCVILHFTYHKPLLFFGTNLVVDAFLSYGASAWFEHLGIYTLQNATKFHVLLLTTFLAVLIFLFQKWLDPVLKTTKGRDA